MKIYYKIILHIKQKLYMDYEDDIKQRYQEHVIIFQVIEKHIINNKSYYTF